MNVSIREAHQADVSRLLDLYRQLNIAPEPEMPIERARGYFLELVSNPRHRIYVAELQRQIVGTFSLIYAGGISHGARDSCLVEDVVVAPEVQRSGIGRHMMRFAMDQCFARDCYKLVLSSHVKREEAHRFYESLGFRKHGHSYLVDPRSYAGDCA